MDDSKSFENQTRDNSGIRQLRRGRGLENSSFSLKQKQLDIILKNNPVEDDYHTWIRSIDDIKTLEEALNDGDWSDYDEFNPDLTKQDIEAAPGIRFNLASNRKNRNFPREHHIHQSR